MIGAVVTICAEWEFGGLPAWLLERHKDPKWSPAFIEAVVVIMIAAWVVNTLPSGSGGPILMMQVENEYGSYGEDKDYLRAIRDLMKEKDVSSLFTSDGPWRATLRTRP